LLRFLTGLDDPEDDCNDDCNDDETVVCGIDTNMEALLDVSSIGLGCIKFGAADDETESDEDVDANVETCDDSVADVTVGANTADSDIADAAEAATVWEISILARHIGTVICGVHD
jgi:hypothetical protein